LLGNARGEVRMKQRRNVLVCDDDPGTRHILKRMLERDHKVNVVQCETGLEALRLLSLGRFCLLILDLRMPGLDGIDTLDAIRYCAPLQNLPVVVLTADGRAE